MKLGMTLLALFLLTPTAMAVQVDAAKSSFRWEASKKIGKGHWGMINLKSSQLKLDGQKIKGAEFIMDMTSFSVEDLEGKWEKKFLTHVKGSDFFEVDKYPEAKLVLLSIKDNTATGDLTIKKETQPTTIQFKKKGRTYTGKLKFDRTKFGVIYGSQNFFKKLTMDKIIDNDVFIDFKVILKE